MDSSAETVSVHGTKHGQAEVALIEEFTGQITDLFLLDAVDAGKDLVHREVGIKVDFVLCQPGHKVVRTFETEKEISFQLLFCGFQFPVSEGIVLEAVELLQDEIDDLLKGIFARSRIDDKQSRIDEGWKIGVNGVGQAPVLADLLKEPGTHASPQDRIEHVGSKPKGMIVLKSLRAKAEMDLLQIPLPDIGRGNRLGS